MHAKRCAAELGSDRWPRRCVSPDTTWRFCVRCGSLCLCSCSADVLHMGCRRVVCLDGTTRGRRQPHRAEDLGLTPDAQGGAAEALRTPAPCVRSTLPPCPATFLSPLHKQARPASAGGDEARGGRRSVAWYLCPHGAEVACRSRAPGRIVWRAWPTPCPRLVVVWSAPTAAAFTAPQAVEPRPQQSSVRLARAPLVARAAVTVAATSAKSVGDSRSRTSRSPPTCAPSTAPSPTI